MGRANRRRRLHGRHAHGGARFEAESSEKKKFDSLPNAEEFLEKDLATSVAASLDRLDALASAKRKGLTE